MNGATMNLFPRLSPRGVRGTLAALACVSSVALAGCNLTKEPMAMAPPLDPEQAHPIVLTQAPILLEVFPVGGRIDPRDAARIQEFVDRYKQLGGGRIVIGAPKGASYGQAMEDVKRDLAQSGLHAMVAIGSYPAPADGVSRPIKLTYRGLEAKVATQCGQWPTDLASGSSVQGWANTAYPNYGCAYQNMLASEVADPRDLAGPHALDPADAGMRMRAITAVRAGQDPGTDWKTKLTPIGAIGD
jgi:pilus assembly protein CpaD